MSSVKVQFNNDDEVRYDFTDFKSRAYGENSMANLRDGKFGIVRRSNTDGIINDDDFKTIGNTIFSSGYIQGDLDMNGVVNVFIYYFVNKNISRSTQSSLTVVKMSEK